MQKFIYDTWNIVTFHNKNPLKNIPDNNVRHMILQVFAFMWCALEDSNPYHTVYLS